MLTILSPAKSLNLESPAATDSFTVAEMLADSEKLIEALRKKSPDEIANIMKISDDLAQLNTERYLDWDKPTKPGADTRQAIFAFDGDVYKGFDSVVDYSKLDFDFTQSSLRILSGLYGALRPLDLIRPYRLEMGTKMKFGEAANLYQFWDTKITDHIRQALDESTGDKVLVNLASNEYSKVVKPKELTGSVLSPVFLDSKDGGEYKIVSFFAKKARGAMAGWIMNNQIKKMVDLANFDALGYKYSKKHSTELAPTFTRRNKTKN